MSSTELLCCVFKFWFALKPWLLTQRILRGPPLPALARYFEWGVPGENPVCVRRLFCFSLTMLFSLRLRLGVFLPKNSWFVEFRSL